MNTNIPPLTIDINQKYIPSADELTLNKKDYFSAEEIEQMLKRPRQDFASSSVPLQPRSNLSEATVSDATLGSRQSIDPAARSSNNCPLLEPLTEKEENEILTKLQQRDKATARVVFNILSYLKSAHLEQRFYKNPPAEAFIKTNIFDNPNPAAKYFCNNGNINNSQFPNQTKNKLLDSEKYIFNKYYKEFLTKINYDGNFCKDKLISNNELLRYSELIKIMQHSKAASIIRRDPKSMRRFFIYGKPTQLTIDRIGHQLTERENNEAKNA